MSYYDRMLNNQALSKLLDHVHMFTDDEREQLTMYMASPSLGNLLDACEATGMDLTDADVDELAELAEVFGLAD